MWSVRRSTSSSTLYSDVVKIPLKGTAYSVSGLKPSVANKIQRTTIKEYGRSYVNAKDKVSINDVCHRSVIAKENIKSSEQKHVGLKKESCSGVVMNVNNSNVDISDQDYVDITHVNRFAVLCVGSSEDEGDSLDLDTVNNPNASCTVKGFQGCESVGCHSKLGKKYSDFSDKSLVHVSKCQSVVNSPKVSTSVDQSDKSFNRNLTVRPQL